MLDFNNSPIQKASKMSNTIKSEIGLDGNLVKLGFVTEPDKHPPTKMIYGFCPDIVAESSIYFAILENLLGNEKSAKETKTEAEKRIGLDGNLIKNYRDTPHILSFTNAGFGILNYMLGEEEKATAIDKDIDSRFGFNQNLLRRRRNNEALSDEISLHPTAAKGIFSYFLGEKDKARMLRDTIENQFGFDDGLLNDGNTGRVLNGAGTELVDHRQFNADDNFSFAILEYLLGNEERSSQIGEKAKNTLGKYKGLVISTSMPLSHVYSVDSSLYGIWLLRKELKSRVRN